MCALGDAFERVRALLPERIHAARLALRPFTPQDAAAMHAYWTSDPDWPRFNRSVPSDPSPADAEAFVAELVARDREDRPSWAIDVGGEVVGIVALTFEQGHRIAVVGYGVHGKLRGRGLAGEATAAAIGAAFREYPQLARIRAHMDATNSASARVLEKLGFLREATLRSNQYDKGALGDEAIFGLLRAEWEQHVSRSVRSGPGRARGA